MPRHVSLKVVNVYIIFPVPGALEFVLRELNFFANWQQKSGYATASCEIEYFEKENQYESSLLMNTVCGGSPDMVNCEHNCQPGCIWPEAAL